MKLLKIRYAKAVCLSVIYIFIVLAVSIGVPKLFGQDMSIDGLCMTLAMSAILLHFMEKEDKEDEK